MKIGFLIQDSKILCVTFDNQFNLNHHISKICKTASNKISNVNYNFSGGSQFHQPSANKYGMDRKPFHTQNQKFGM